MKNFKMLSAVVETDAEVINPNGEKFVDLMVKPGLPLTTVDVPGTGTTTNVVPPQVYGLIGPGEAVGEELTIRIVAQRRAKAMVGGGMFPSEQHTSNQTDVILLGIPPALLDVPQDAFVGVPRWGSSLSWPLWTAGLRFTKFEKDDGTINEGRARFITLKWLGTYWAASALSEGIYVAGDPEDVAPAVEA